jgi:ApaG protein
VVGETPTIKPGGHFKYNSGCNLNSEIGYMKGFYTLKDILTGKQFDVQIPKFDLIVPAKLN